jgi:hypothetical protein
VVEFQLIVRAPLVMIQFVALDVLMASVPVPVPLRATVWLAGSVLPVMTRLLLYVVARKGAKVSATVQLDPALRLVPQVFVCRKLAVLPPVMPRLLIVSVPLPAEAGAAHADHRAGDRAGQGHRLR